MASARTAAGPPASSVGATSLGGERRRQRPADLAGAANGKSIAADSAQLLQQDESNKLLAGQLAALDALQRPPSDHDEEGDQDESRPLASCESNLARATPLDEGGAGERKDILGLDEGRAAANCRSAGQLEAASQLASNNNNNNINNNNHNNDKQVGAAEQLKWGAKRGAQLAKQESVFEQEEREQREFNARARAAKEAEARRHEAKRAESGEGGGASWCAGRWFVCLWCEKMFGRQGRLCCLLLLLPLLLTLIYSAAIYCLPFVKIQTSTISPLPAIPFNFQEGPLRASSASAYKIKHLFKDQLHGAESLALDKQANLYMAIEGGFILWARLNASSPIRRAYLESAIGAAISSQRQVDLSALFGANRPELIKIAELNGPKQPATTTAAARRLQRDGQLEQGAGWRRECQLDEQIYGQQLFTTTSEKASKGDKGARGPYFFKSNVRVSRCSKPLGIRLSPDESALYVIDTLNGLYRVNLRQAERFGAPGQRQVNKLLDFRANNGHHVLPAVQLDPADGPEEAGAALRLTRYMNVSLRAVDDLAIDFGAGSQGGDLIYLSVASQWWPAVSFVYDRLEGRPSGVLLRLDTGANQLVVLEPTRLAHVRLTDLHLEIKNRSQPIGAISRRLVSESDEPSVYYPGVLLGAPRLNENDVFDDRPLHFPNGLELMADRQALLIADTSNKRIIKHWIRGPRRGSSDLWAWTPHYPDNIRRGFERRSETYWVVGCGRAPKGASGGGQAANELNYERLVKQNAANSDLFEITNNWPRLRKFLLKNIYFTGAMLEFMGAHVFRSVSLQDYGYELKTGSNLCSQGCLGMMVLQYNKHGDLIRSIHSREFPNDLTYYSQANELIDGQAAEHALYLGSPSYSYVTKLILPTETRPWPDVDGEGASP